MNFEEFLKKPEEEPRIEEPQGEEPSGEEELTTEVELDVHKEVVAELAAEKAALEERIASLSASLDEEKAKTTSLEKENRALAEKIAGFDAVKAEMVAALAKVGDTLARNTEKPVSNQISVLDRNPEVDDRFDGETRDHILEVLSEARAVAEREGRLRRAQLLEAVLAANEPCGTLAKRRADLDKLFADNMNIINGEVINALDNLGIRYKDGENYLLAKEIAKRSY